MDTNTEKVFYRDLDVTVTQTRFISHSKTYAMRNISSVSLGRIDRSIVGEILLVVIGTLMCIGDETRIAGIIMIVIAIVLFFVRKDSYSVRINSNSGEADGFISKDKEVIQKVVNAVNEAIVFRG
jgi:type IV secretory pathway component VirB8